MTAPGHVNIAARVRPAAIDDIPDILWISNYYAAHTPVNFAIKPESLESWRESWQLTHERFPWLIASDTHDVIVGFARAAPWKGRCAYNWTAEVTAYVHPNHLGRGIGRALYMRLFAILTAQGFHAAIAGITLPNPASVMLHESFGMKHIGTFDEVGWKFGRWHDVGYWIVTLNESTTEPKAVRSVRAVLSEAEADR